MLPKLHVIYKSPEKQDNDLLERCLASDRLAQKQLYDRYRNAMYTLCVRIAGNSDDAKDILQEAFIKVFLNLHAFKKESAIGAWIKKIVLRTAIDFTRKRMFFTTIDNIPEISEEELPENLSGEFLQEAICGLPSGCRTIFILIEVEGYSHREVAEMLGISEGTSKSQLFHAKKLLKRKCKEFQG